MTVYKAMYFTFSSITIGYTVDWIWHCSDPAAGSSADYVKGVLGVKYAFAAELRASSAEEENNFVADKRQIQPSFEEIWSGIVAMCDTIAAKD